ncbi:MAG: VOC family protein [Aquihabitans sp.]
MGDTGSELTAVVFGAADPPNLARFWARALAWEVDGEATGAVELVPTDGTRLTLRFEPLASDQTSRHRLHLDLTTSSDGDQQRTADELVGLGATHVDYDLGPDERHIVLADPEGNELCLIEPENKWLAGCPRLGAINADGTQATGVFWSEALGWPLIWDQDGETAIRHPDGTGPIISWSGPPLNDKRGRNRIQLQLAHGSETDPDAEVARLVSLGASELARRSDRIDLADPDANELTLRR